MFTYFSIAYLGAIRAKSAFTMLYLFAKVYSSDLPPLDHDKSWDQKLEYIYLDLYDL